MVHVVTLAVPITTNISIPYLKLTVGTINKWSVGFCKLMEKASFSVLHIHIVHVYLRNYLHDI